jgi:hypothetical protein
MGQRSLGHIHRAIRVRLGVRQDDLSKASGSVARRFRGWSETCSPSSPVETCRPHSRLWVHGSTHVSAGTVLRWIVSEFGERGSIDILAWHAGQRILLVVEIKTELASLDGLLRPLDVKVRLAPRLARERFGWQAAAVGRIVVLPEDSSARRAASRHESILRTALPARSHDARRWLAHPQGPIAGLWFLSEDRTVSTTRSPSSVRRVRRGRRSSNERDIAH